MNESISLSKENERQFKRKVHKTKDKISKGTLVVADFADRSNRKPHKNVRSEVTIPNLEPTRIKKPRAERGLIYVGHLPHGFYEEEMRKFFGQFGIVTNCRVNRSPRTGASKGFGHIEFVNTEVAKVAAETMNNYLLFRRRLITKYIPPSRQYVNIFRAHAWNKRFNPLTQSRKLAHRVYNNNTYVNYEEECRGMIKSIQIKIDKLKELGISYTFKFNDVPDFISNEPIAEMSDKEDSPEEEFSTSEESDN